MLSVFDNALYANDDILTFHKYFDNQRLMIIVDDENDPDIFISWQTFGLVY